MVDRRRTVNIFGAGTFPLLFQRPLRRACDEVGATCLLQAQAAFDANIGTTTSLRSDFGRDGVIDVSPSDKDLKNAAGFLGSDDRAEANRTNWEAVANRMIQRVVDAQHAAQVVDGFTLWLQGLKTGHRRLTNEMLRLLKSKLPLQDIAVLSPIPEDADKRQELRTGYDTFTALKREDIIALAILVDNRSPFACRFTLRTQDDFLAKGIASGLVAQHQFAKNRALGEVCVSLGKHTTLAGVSFASCALAVPAQPAWWRGLRSVLGWLPPRGWGDIGNIITEAQRATTAAVTDPDASAIGEPIDTDRPFFLIYTVPIMTRDSVRWETFTNQMRRWLAATFKSATPIFASGNGTPDPRGKAPYWVQVTALFPIPDVPAPIKEILQGTDLSEGTKPKRGRPPKAAVQQNGYAAFDPVAVRQS